MQQYRHTSTRESSARSELTLAGLLGYLAVAAGALAFLSAPLVTAVALLVLGTVAALVRSLPARRSVASGTDDASALGPDAAAE